MFHQPYFPAAWTEACREAVHRHEGRKGDVAAVGTLPLPDFAVESDSAVVAVRSYSTGKLHLVMPDRLTTPEEFTAARFRGLPAPWDPAILRPEFLDHVEARLISWLDEVRAFKALAK